eukprot:jgi/Chrzof1/7499/Cz02g26020.t1
MGSMDLAELGSADMEHLLQGVGIDELYGSQLLFPGGMESGVAGAQDVLLRLVETPALLQQVLAGAGNAASNAGHTGSSTGQQPQQQRQGGSSSGDAAATGEPAQERQG